MILKLFIQPHCPACPPAKELVQQLKPKAGELKLKIEEFDVSTVEGLTEASFYSIFATPNLVLCDDQGREIKSWRQGIPSQEEILREIK